MAGLARAAVLFALLTVALTWPMVTRLRIVDAGDSAFFAWAIGWELHALGADAARLPHGNFFHPLRYTLGMDEPVLGTTLLVAPLALFTTDAVLLFNVARLLTFLVSALTAYACARGLGSAEGPALVAGAAFAFSPIRTDQIGHLSTLGRSGSRWSCCSSSGSFGRDRRATRCSPRPPSFCPRWPAAITA